MRTVLLLALVGGVVLAAAAQSATSPTAAAPLAASSSAAWPTAQFTAVASKDPSVRKAKQILDEMIRALGGDAYLNLRDMKLEGRGYAFYQGRPSGTGTVFWRFWEWPDKDRVELTKQRDVIEINVADRGYEVTYKGTTTQEPKLLAEYLRRRDHSIEWVIRQWLAAPGTMIIYEGTTIVEQNLADKVTIMNAANDSVTLAVDPRTHLPVKKTYSWRDPMDRQMDEEAELFSNYKLIQGINTPYATVRTENGEMRSQRFVNNVSYNNGFDPAIFEPKGLTYNQQQTSGKKP